MPPYFYFRAPTFDISANSPTAPKLGSIFSSLRRLTGPLNQDDYVSIPASLTNESAKPDFTDVVGKSINGAAGIYANIAQGIAGSGDLVYAFAKDKTSIFQCELLETLEFEPNVEFIANCIASSQRVQNFIDDSFLGNKRVYMITGLKVATGFSMTTLKSSEHGPMLRIGFNSTALGIPVESGPQLELRVGSSRAIFHGKSTSKIIFAYRAIKISLRRDGRPKYKDVSGGQYNLGSDNSDEEDQLWDIEQIDEQGILKEFPESVLIIVEREDEGR